MRDDADVALEELPAVDQASAPADVFYVHPTTWIDRRWNGPVDDPAVIEATARGGTLIQASVFNACCAVYAPRYRQANGNAYVDASPTGDQAIDVAYADVSEAFRSFWERRGAHRPFILASHSQGTVLATRLLREEIWGKEAGEHLVVAYLIGGPIAPETLPGVPICASAEQTGCVVAWNARGPRYVGNALAFRRPGVSQRADPLAGRICVNPLTWRTDEVAAPASAHEGALFFDAEVPAVLPAFADARCTNGRLLVTEIGDAPRDFMSGVLDWMMGPENYHPIEFQLYYMNLRNNAVARVQAAQRSAEVP